MCQVHFWMMILQVFSFWSLRRPPCRKTYYHSIFYTPWCCHTQAWTCRALIRTRVCVKLQEHVGRGVTGAGHTEVTCFTHAKSLKHVTPQKKPLVPSELSLILMLSIFIKRQGFLESSYLDSASVFNTIWLLIFYVFLHFFLPVSKKRGFRLCKFSKWKQNVSVISLSLCLFYYYLMILVLLARCIVKRFYFNDLN